MSNESKHSGLGNGHDRDEGHGEMRLTGRNEPYDRERERREQPWSPGDPRSASDNIHQDPEHQRNREDRPRPGHGSEDDFAFGGPDDHGGFGSRLAPEQRGYGRGSGYDRSEDLRGSQSNRPWQNDRSLQRGNRGKGPRGFTRSDERIREDVCERLTEDDLLDASGIEVEVNRGEVILTGVVDNRAAKRRAEDIIEDCPGVIDVQNSLRVNRP